jgi:hypothetical protein
MPNIWAAHSNLEGRAAERLMFANEVIPAFA